MDNSKLIALTLLHRSATFDISDHNIPLQRDMLGNLAEPLCGLVRVCQTDTKDSIHLVHNLPPNIFHLEFYRDFSLVLLFFGLYTTTLNRTISNHGINHHFYTDATLHMIIYNFHQPIHIDLCQL